MAPMVLSAVLALSEALMSGDEAGRARPRILRAAFAAEPPAWAVDGLALPAVLGLA